MTRRRVFERAGGCEISPRFIFDSTICSFRVQPRNELHHEQCLFIRFITCLFPSRTVNLEKEYIGLRSSRYNCEKPALESSTRRSMDDSNPSRRTKLHFIEFSLFLFPPFCFAIFSALYRVINKYIKENLV